MNSSFDRSVRHLRDSLNLGRRPGRRKRGSGARPESYRPRFERLEERTLLATYTVNNSVFDAPDNNVGDGICDASPPFGLCSLRAAIQESNASVGTPDTIHFTIPVPGVQTITLISDLPAITDPVVIDGYTQPGASPNTNGPGLGDNAVIRIELNANFKEGLMVNPGGE